MKNNIIKASEELFPIKAEMSLDEQSDQLLRQIGFKFGANWAIEKACEAFCMSECNGKPPRSTCTSLGTCEKFDFFVKAMKGGEEWKRMNL